MVEIKRSCANIEKIKAIGFKPRFNLKEGLKKTIEYYKNEKKA